MHHAPMIRPLRFSDQKRLIPKALLRAMAALVLWSLALVAYATWSGTPPAAPQFNGAEVADRVIQIKADGAGSSVHSEDGTLLFRTQDAGNAGFITAVRVGLAHERKVHGVDGNPPVRLVRFSDGRLGLHDPATDWKIMLQGFGRDSLAAFAQFLPTNPTTEGESG